MNQNWTYDHVYDGIVEKNVFMKSFEETSSCESLLDFKIV